MHRRPIIEALLFLIAMPALAVLVFGVFAGIIHGGNWLVSAAMSLLSGIGLPRPAAFALAVLATAGLVTAAWTLLSDGFRRRKPSRR